MSTLAVNTIQAETGSTVTVASGHALDASNGLTTPAGHIIQVVQSTTLTGFSTASTSWVRCTNLSASITPTSTSSKILVLINGWMTTAQYTRYVMLSILRSSDGGSTYTDISGTTLQNGSNSADGIVRIYDGGTSINEGNRSIQFLDSPGTTSALNYAPSIRHGTGNSAGAYFGQTNLVSTMQLIEVAG